MTIWTRSHHPDTGMVGNGDLARRQLDRLRQRIRITRDRSPSAGDRPSRRRRRWWLAGFAGFAVGAGGAWWVASTTQSPEQAAARAAEPAASWITARAEQRVLSMTVIQRGDVRAEHHVIVGVPVSVEGTAVVTRQAPEVGQAVVEGDQVVEVSGRPVLVLEGDVPVYRSLRPGMSGPDVSQLQVALSRLGHSPDTDGVYGEATKQAVADFYRTVGYEPLPAFESAATELDAADVAVSDAEEAVADASDALADAGAGDVATVEAQIAVTQAERVLEDARARRVSNVRLAEEEYNAAIRDRDRLRDEGTATAAELEAAELRIMQQATSLDELRRATANEVATAEESLRIAQLGLEVAATAEGATRAERDLAAAVATLERARQARDEAIARNGPTVAQGEIVFVPQLPARVRAASAAPDASAAVVADGESASNALVELSSGELVIDTIVRPADVGLIRVGMRAELLHETTSTTYTATVSALAPDATTGPDGSLGHPVVLTLDDDLPDSLTGANLRVTFTTASTDSDVLVVPLAAVSSSADGSAWVSLVDSPDDPEPVDVAVETGLSADGFVVITGVRQGSVGAGDLVVIGS